MLTALACFVLLYAQGSNAHPSKSDHEISSLPGWAEGSLPSRQFSGLMPIANGTKHLHYWLVQSEDKPESDPLVVWLQGGPGASSIMGYLTEMGPFLTNDDSFKEPVDGVPTLFYNPHSWARVANLLFLESPAGVGFSYCTEDGNAAACQNNDTTTADDSADFFHAFYEAYPEFKSRDLYLTGESYAGVYLPMLAERLIKEQPHVPLKGMAVGNGCWGTKVGICSGSGDSMAIATEFFHQHDMFDDALWEDMQEHCDWYNVSQACEGKVAEMRRQLGTFFVYNIYDTCITDQALPPTFDDMFELQPERTYRLNPEVFWRLRPGACGRWTAMAQWLAHEKVQEALHVKGGTPGQTYTLTVPDLRPLYKWLSDKMRVLIYSGDVDSCVPTLGTEAFFLRTLNMTNAEPWAQWQCTNEHGFYARAGYHKKFGGTKHGIDFITINGAGHMVPEYKPVQALEFLTRWLRGDSLRDDEEQRFAAVSELKQLLPTDGSQA